MNLPHSRNWIECRQNGSTYRNPLVCAQAGSYYLQWEMWSMEGGVLMEHSVYVDRTES
jgi:hypothetical protein